MREQRVHALRQRHTVVVDTNFKGRVGTHQVGDVCRVVRDVCRIVRDFSCVIGNIILEVGDDVAFLDAVAKAVDGEIILQGVLRRIVPQ